MLGIIRKQIYIHITPKIVRERNLDLNPRSLFYFIFDPGHVSKTFYQLACTSKGTLEVVLPSENMVPVKFIGTFTYLQSHDLSISNVT